SSKSDESVPEWQASVDEKPHGHRGGVPSTRNQPLEDTPFRGNFVQVKGLRIKFGGKLLDPRRFHDICRGRKSLTNVQVFQIKFSYGLLHIYFFLGDTPYRRTRAQFVHS